MKDANLLTTPNAAPSFKGIDIFKGTVFSSSSSGSNKTEMSAAIEYKIEKIDIESQLTGYSSAGCITYVELDSGIKNNIEALETIVNYAMDKDIPYFAVNVPVDDCLDCGHSGEFNDHCPECGSENIQQLRRVTGYLTGNYKTAFNKGKQQEVEMRVKHGGLK